MDPKLIAAMDEVTALITNLGTVPVPPPGATADNPYAGVGPSGGFTGTHLPAPVLTDAEVTAMVKAIDDAVTTGNFALVSRVLQTVTGIFGPIKLLLGVK